MAAAVIFLVASVPLGQVLGSLLSVPSSFYTGRKVSVLVASAPVLGGWLLLSITEPDVRS